jgi:hypothetical protein
MLQNFNFSAKYNEYTHDDTINNFLNNALNDGWTVTKIKHQNIYLFSKNRHITLNNINSQLDDVDNNDFLSNFINKYLE